MPRGEKTVLKLRLKSSQKLRPQSKRGFSSLNLHWDFKADEVVSVVVLELPPGLEISFKSQF